MADFPVLDLSLSDAELAPRLRAVCVAHGFFYASNAVPADLLTAAFDASRALFALPLEQKRALLASAATANRGWTVLGEEVRSAVKQGRAGAGLVPEAAARSQRCADWPRRGQAEALPLSRRCLTPRSSALGTQKRGTTLDGRWRLTRKRLLCRFTGPTCGRLKPRCPGSGPLWRRTFRRAGRLATG